MFCLQQGKGLYSEFQLEFGQNVKTPFPSPTTFLHMGSNGGLWVRWSPDDDMGLMGSRKNRMGVGDDLVWKNGKIRFK